MFLLFSLGVLVTPIFVFIFILVKQQIRSARSPLRKLPGPPSQSWYFGNVKYVFEKGQTVAWDEWMATYGKTFQYPVMFGVRFFSHRPWFRLTSEFIAPFAGYHGSSGNKSRPHALR